MKKHRALYDHNDQNYKNSVFVDKGWQEVSQEFSEPVSDCKKKWRHLRSSLSRYLKSSKDIVKNKNNKLKPYYLLTHMDFLIPYTKTLDVSLKAEPDDQNNVSYSADMKAEDENGYENLIQEDESQNMEEDDDVVYEAYEIQEHQASSSNPQKPQITLVRSSGNAQTAGSIPQLQPLTINASPVKSQQIQLNTSQISQITVAQQQHQQSQPGQQHLTAAQQSIPLQNTIIPVQDDQSSADLNFFLALLPDIRTMTNEQKRRLRIGTLKLIDEILSTS